MTISVRASLRMLTRPACYRAWELAHYEMRHDDRYRLWSDRQRWVAAMAKVFETALEVQAADAARERHRNRSNFQKENSDNGSYSGKRHVDNS